MMPVWLMVVIGLALLVLGRVVFKALSEHRYNKMIERRLMARVQEYRDAGYSNEQIYIEVEHGVALVRVHE